MQSSDIAYIEKHCFENDPQKVFDKNCTEPCQEKSQFPAVVLNFDGQTVCCCESWFTYKKIKDGLELK